MMKGVRERRGREGISYWSSYSDMMAALILVLVLLLCVTLALDRLVINQERQKYGEIKGEYDAIIGVREEIIDQLKKEFGDNADIQIDKETGDILLKSKILFDYDQAVLLSEGKEFLKDFFPKYIQILMREGTKDNISEIIVEGHTDTQGTYTYNLDLSQDRATSVVRFCMDEKNEILSQEEIIYLQKKISSNGKSFSRPKDTDEESRRVEIKFSLYEEEQIKKLIEMWVKG